MDALATGRMVAGVRRGRVAYLAVYDRTRIRTLGALKRTCAAAAELGLEVTERFCVRAPGSDT